MGGAWFKSRSGLIEVSRGFIHSFQTNARVESLLVYGCSGFDPKPLHVGFVADKVAPEIVFHLVQRFSTITIIQPALHAHISFIYPRQCIILATKSVVKSDMLLCICNCLLPTVFQFIIHQSPWHQTVRANITAALKEHTLSWPTVATPAAASLLIFSLSLCTNIGHCCILKFIHCRQQITNRRHLTSYLHSNS